MSPSSQNDPLVIDGSGLDLQGLEEVARFGRPVALAPGAREAVVASRRVVDDAVERGAVVYGVTTGFGNFADVHIPLDRLRELVEVERLVILRPPVPPLAARLLEAKAREVAGSRGIDAQVVEAPATAAEVLALLPPQLDAVYVVPLLHMEEEELRRLAEAFVARRLPSFAAAPEDVELGMLASTTRQGDVDRLARRVAIENQVDTGR